MIYDPFGVDQDKPNKVHSGPKKFETNGAVFDKPNKVHSLPKKFETNGAIFDNPNKVHSLPKKFQTNGAVFDNPERVISYSPSLINKPSRPQRGHISSYSFFTNSDFKAIDPKSSILQSIL
jgi:hypothetical protein